MEKPAKSKRPASHKKRADAVPRAPGQRVAAGRKIPGGGGGTAAPGAAKKPRQNFVRIDKKVGRRCPSVIEGGAWKCGQ